MKNSDRLDEILLRHGWVTEAQIIKTLNEQRNSGERFGSIMVRMGYLSESQLSEALAEQYGTPVWDPETAIVETAALELFAEKWLQQKGVLPLAYDKKRKHLEVAVTDPTDIALADEIRFQANIKSLTMTVVPEISLRRLWNAFSAGEATKKNGPTSPADQTNTLGLKFSFGLDAVDEQKSPSPSEKKTGVLLWLSQPFVAKLLKSLLEVEMCRVEVWNGVDIPTGNWHYVIYDEDQSASQPSGAARLKKAQPQIQFVPRPSWTTSLLRSPLSYERLRDGYVHLIDYFTQQLRDGRIDRRLSRYALAAARILPLTQFEIDSLMAACELAPLLADRQESPADWEQLAEDLRCPYPVIDIYRCLSVPFNESESKPGESSVTVPLTGKIFTVVSAFLKEIDRQPLSSIESLSQLTEWLRRESGKMFDPMAVEALLRVVQEEVLEGCLPPGPSEVMMVADRPVEWHHLVMQLENDGWRVVMSKGAVEARREAERRKPDVVVWAADGAMEWIRWQAQALFDVTNFLILDQPDTSLERAALEAGFEDVWSGDWDAGVAVAKLQRAVIRREKTQGEMPTVTGSLQQLSFVDMVQILAAGSRSVRIDLQSDNQKASVILWQGRIMHAQAPGKDGEEAVYDVLSWEAGTFGLHPIYAEPPVNCTQPNDMILLEGCRLMDEQRASAPAAKTTA